MGIEPDTKDWTWVLDQRCTECGLDVAAIPADQIAAMIRDNARHWQQVRTRTEPAWWHQRPDHGTWSPLEYASHVRDVHGVFATRLQAIRTQDNPTFTDWNQDEAAVQGRYQDGDPDEVLAALATAADDVAAQYESLTAAQWQRPGLRSDGMGFTGVTLARYHLHDVVHHLGDITGPGRPPA